MIGVHHQQTDPHGEDTVLREKTLVPMERCAVCAQLQRATERQYVKAG